jgi:hypothetical protein
MIGTLERPKKRLFIALMLASTVLISGAMYAVWRVSFLGLANIGEYLPHILGAAFIMAAGLVLFGIVGMVFAVLGIPTVKICHKQAWTAINLLFPLAVMIGKLINADREKIERSFIAVSNQIISNRHIKVKPNELLVVTPHCLQENTCPHKITRDPNNCKKCGRCPVGSLVSLAQELGFHFYIVTGGTLARQTIKNIRPKAILAIACERDLTSGIQDVYPLPVIGVLNQRPCGPCNNTRVDVAAVEQAIRDFLE